MFVLRYFVGGAKVSTKRCFRMSRSVRLFGQLEEGRVLELDRVSSDCEAK